MNFPLLIDAAALRARVRAQVEARVASLSRRGFVCRIGGHVNAATMLPEEEFGLYAYSRLFCSRCDRTEAELTPDQEAEAHRRWDANPASQEMP